MRMNGRILNQYNDIFTESYIENGVTKYRIARALTFKQKVMRNISCVLKTFEGECFTDYDAGVPWFDNILGNSVLFTDEISQEIKDKILEVDGVEKVVDIAVKIDGRNVSGKFKVMLSDGSTEKGEF